MTSFLSNTPDILKSAPRVIDRGLESFSNDSVVDRDSSVDLKRIRMDSAIELNRKFTDPAAADKRMAPRYSVREINTLNNEQLRSRLESINQRENTPGIVKVLDILDLPRNVIGNFIGDVFLPEAKQAALERGEFDQFGNVKIWGGDYLRAMGVENRVVNAIAGFGIDIVTDPLSWLGGPIGGLKTAGTRGGVTVSKAGQRALKSGIKAVAAGRTIGDDATRTLIEATLRRAPAGIDAVEKSRFVAKELLGESGRLSKAADTFGLGLKTKGGAIAEDSFKVVTGKGAQEADQIAAVKGFVSKYTNNRGLDLTKGKGGAEIAHVPFTDLTLTVPGFKLGPINAGRAAVVQKAIANALEGNPAAGAALMASKNTADTIALKANEIEGLVEARLDRNRLIATETDPIKLQTLEIENELDSQKIIDLGVEVADLTDSRLATANFTAGNPTPLEPPLNMSVGDMLATAEYSAKARDHAKLAKAHTRHSDVQNLVARATKEDVAQARKLRNHLTDELVEAAGLDPDTVFDDIASLAQQDAALKKIVDVHKNRADRRYSELLDLRDKDLNMAEINADAFHDVATSAADVAERSGRAVRDFIGSDNRLIADAAKRVLRVDGQEMGDLPLAGIGAFFRKLGHVDGDDRVSRFGFGTAVNFGGVRGEVPGAMAAMRRAVTGADDEGARVAAAWRHGGEQFTHGFDEIATKHGVTSENYQTLTDLVSALIESRGYDRAGAPRRVFATGADTPAGKMVIDAQQGGLLANPQLMSDLERLADETIDAFNDIGAAKIRRGDISTAFTHYMPVELRAEAAARAKAVHKGSSGGTKAVDKFVDAMLNTEKARDTNLVEFTDANGVQHSFMLMEANIAQSLSDEDLLQIQQTNPDWFNSIMEIRDSVDAFIAKHAQEGEDIADTMRDLSSPVMPSELNAMAMNGDLRTLRGLVGGDLVDMHRVFETDPAVLLSKAVRADRIAEAKAGFNDAISPFILTRIANDKDAALKIGDKATLSTGESITRIGNKRYQTGDGRIYRSIDADALEADSFFMPGKVMNDAQSEAIIPEVLAVAMERMNQTLTPAKMGDVMSLVNKTTSWFKTSTLLHPSWLVANAMGNVLLAAMDDPQLLTNPKRTANFFRFFKDAVRIETERNLSGIAGVGKVANKTRAGVAKVGLSDSDTIMVAGRPQRIDDLMRDADRGGVANGAVAGDLQQQMFETSNRNMPLSGNTPQTGVVGQFKDRRARAKAHLENRRGSLGGGRVGNAIENTRATGEAVKNNVIGNGLKTWFTINGSIDNTFRTALYLMKINDGIDPVTAATQVRRAMLNFGDLSNLETNVIRPLIPFYSWTRASLPNFLSRAVRQPSQMSATPKLINALEELLAGEDRIPRDQRPSWLQQQLAIQVGTDPESLTSIGIGTMLPQEGSLQAISGAIGLTNAGAFNGGDFMDSLNWLYGQAGPAVKIPAELAFGRESFTGRTIGTKGDGADLSLSEYAMGQIRLAREFGVGQSRRGAFQRAADQGLVPALGRTALGGRFSQGLREENRETSFFFELKEREANLRKTIRREQANGNTEEASRFKYELLALYSDYLHKGGDEADVPKWAREDLANLGSP